MKQIRNIFLLLGCLSALILRGQTIPYKLYTPQDGLPQSQIQCIFQDSRSYIWVGTFQGLARFNGVNFDVLRPQDGLPNSYVRQIQEDAKGNIWFSSGKYLCKYDGQKITFDTTAVRFEQDYFCFDKNYTMWTIDANDHLLYYSKDYKNWLCASKEYSPLADKKWAEVYFDKFRNRLLLQELNEKGSFAFQNKELIKLSASKTVFSATNFRTNVYQELGFRGDSIFKIEERGTTFLAKTNDKTMNSIAKMPNGKIYFANRSKRYLYILNPSGTIDSVFTNAIPNSFFPDKNQNLWLGTEQGLIRFFTNGFRNFDTKNLNGIWSMVEDRKGNMWFGEYDSEKLTHFTNGRLKEMKINYPIYPTFKKQISDFGKFYFGGGHDNKGNIYFPMVWGVMKYDGYKFSPFSLGNPSLNHVLSMTIYIDTVRNILISGVRGGVNITDLATRKEKYYGHDKGLQKVGFVLGIAKDRKGDYWFATSGSIARFDFAKDSIVKNYSRSLNNFLFYGAKSLLVDDKGTLWVGCSQGLLRYDEQKDSFIMVAKDIIKSSVNALGSCQQKQYLAIGAGDGVYFLDLKAFYTEGGKINVRTFNQHNGYTGIEPNQNSLYVDSKDNVWVAASDIVTQIIPSELDWTDKPLTPYITTINDKRIPYETYQQVILLERGESTAKIFFEAVGFERPFTTEFRYKVDNKKWSDWSADNFAVLDKLSSGTYRFSVQTRPSGTVDDKDIKETSIQFKINMPFYKESYFLFLTIFCLIALGFYIWYAQNRQKQREATAALQREADTEKQEQLELLNTEMSHRVRNNLRVMQSIMSMQERRTANEEIKKALQDGGNRIQAMSLLHNHLIVQKGIEFLTMKPYLEELWGKVNLSYANDSIICTINVPNTLLLPEVFGRHIAIIISELFTNSIKHAFGNQPNPHIEVNLLEHNVETRHALSLHYHDNGQGLPDNWDSKQNKSLGMKLIHGVAEQFKGHIIFDNKGGFCCRIEFPQK